MSDGGYNAMRWKCEQLGCYNKVARPKIEMFAECFPGRIAMGDMDGYVEIAGKFLVMEWKYSGYEVREGQRRAFDGLLKAPNRMFTILCIAGDAHRMNVTSAMHYCGPHSIWHSRDLIWCKRFMTRWATWAESTKEHTACHASEAI